MGNARRIVALGLAGVLTVTAGCNQKDKRTLFDGMYFKTKAAAVDRKVTLADFTVTVKDVAQSLDAARQAGGYAGTRYCIEKFGNSRIDWAVGPDTEPGRLTIADNTLVFRGTCQRP